MNLERARAFCPACGNNKTRSVIVYLEKNKFTCTRCGYGGVLTPHRRDTLLRDACFA